MANLLDASAYVAYPFNSSDLKVVVSAVDIDKDGNCGRTAGAARNGAKRTKDDVVTSADSGSARGPRATS